MNKAQELLLAFALRGTGATIKHDHERDTTYVLVPCVVFEWLRPHTVTDDDDANRYTARIARQVVTVVCDTDPIPRRVQLEPGSKAYAMSEAWVARRVEEGDD